MKRRNGIWIIAGVVVTSLLFIIAQSVIFSEETELLTEQETQTRLAEQMDGEIVFMTESANDFTYEVTRNNGVYHATVSRQDGTIIDLSRDAILEPNDEQTNESEQMNEENNNSNQSEPNNSEPSEDENAEDSESESEEETDPEPEPEPERLSSDEITEQVMQQIDGEVTSVEYHEEAELYTVVVEHELTQTDLELDAFTGEVISRESEDLTPDLAITEEEAETTALGQIQDEAEVINIQLQETEGIIYYIVTLNTSEQEQAIVEINAFSSGVETVTWSEIDETSEEQEDNENTENEEEESD